MSEFIEWLEVMLRNCADHHDPYDPGRHRKQIQADTLRIVLATAREYDSYNQ